MYDYMKGKVSELTPTFITLDNNGIGYLINISLNTYSKLKPGAEATIFVHQVVREDAHLLYGFATKDEREMFRLLISVSGVGASTARVIISSLTAEEVASAIGTANIKVLQSIKGIGEKTAQRIIVELRDKINKYSQKEGLSFLQAGTGAEEAITALIMLGFSKTAVEKVIIKITNEEKGLSVEEIIKRALKVL
jgi:holliday junction DNA helicase RuvA